MPAERGAVADDEQEAARAGQRDVHAARVGEEADLAVVVAAHQVDDDGLLLAALEAVDRADLEAGARSSARSSRSRRTWAS